MIRTSLRRHTTLALAASLLALAVPAPTALAGPGGLWQFTANFNNNQVPDGVTLYGSAAVNSGSLRLTPNSPSTQALAVLGGGKIQRVAITFSYFFDHPGGGLTADGMSFNIGAAPEGITSSTLWEKGAGSGLAVSFDIYDFPENGSLATYGIRVLRNGQVIASAPNAITQADRGQWRSITIILETTGTISVNYNGTQAINNVQTNYVPDPSHRFYFAARTGAESAEQRIDDITLSPSTILTADNCADATPIRADGNFWYETALMTTDGIAACGSPGTNGIVNDVWYSWTAAATGLARFTTVNHATFHTKMALYDDTGPCPEGLGILNCNDGFNGSVYAEFSQRVAAGHRYLLRIGGNPAAIGSAQTGAGFVSITTTRDCPGDFNHSGATNVQDIFDFLATWFAGCP